ncbi:sensor histidine kinase [Amphritea sp.]|uniref:sensor histidine kinase n=1 Tax=Amphritea sp. TaxID=1872502 RepID=UPI003A948126
MNTSVSRIDTAQASDAQEWQQRFNRKRLTFAAALVLFALLSGVMLYNTIKEERTTALREQHEEQITLAVIDINRELGDIRNILRLLSTDSDILDSLSQPSPDIDRIATVFNQFGRAVDHLLQVRWLDSRGYERVRVNINKGKTEIVTASALQDKSNRYYFQSAMQVLPPNIYISPIDLNIENGQIVKPFQPVVRIGFQTTDADGLQPGVLMINYDLTTLIAQIRALSTEHAEIMLVDAWGNWLEHPNTDLEWGALLGQPKHSLKLTDPQLWSRISREKSTILQPYNGELYSSRRITLSSKDAPEVAENVYMVVCTPGEMVKDIQWAALQPTLLLELFILLVGGRILCRDFSMQNSLHDLTQTLEHEKHELKLLNDELDSSLSRQQLLQNELVETRKLSSLGMMVAGVAHELNTPIGGAVIANSSLQSVHRSLKQSINEGLSRQALDNYLMNTDEGLKLVDTNLKRAAGLVKSFKRLALDRANEEVLAFSLTQVVNDLLCTLSPKIKKSPTRITNHIETEFTLIGYPGIVSQILQNLIINALTYGTAAMQGGEIILDAKLKHDWVVITVTDNGSGVALELRDSLFDPFVTSGRGLGHTGLGLHLVHQWVTDLMHGRISVEYPDAGGTRFVIELPQQIEARPQCI